MRTIDRYRTLTWYWYSVSIIPVTATTWYCLAFMAAADLRTSLIAPGALLVLLNWDIWDGLWLGSRTNIVMEPSLNCSTPMIVLLWPNKARKRLKKVGYRRVIIELPWCCRYRGGLKSSVFWKYCNTQLNISGCPPSELVGLWKSTSWHLRGYK